MRVLHVDTGREMRGGQWQVLYLLKELARHGVESVLLSPRASPLYNAAEAAGLAVAPLRWFKIARMASQFDIVHAHDARAHTLALAASRPVIVSRRVAFPVKRGPLSRWKYRRAAVFLCVSDYVNRMLVEAGVPHEKICLVHDGVPFADEFATGERTLIVALDSSDPAKGKSLLENASRMAHIPIHFSRDLEADLARARLFVYITDLEGLGSAALLAMAAGVAVIASRTGGLPEAVAHGESGLLTDNHPEAIARAMKTILNNPALALRMGKRGRALVRERFTIERMGAATLAAYKRLLA